MKYKNRMPHGLILAVLGVILLCWVGPISAKCPTPCPDQGVKGVKSESEASGGKIQCEVTIDDELSTWTCPEYYDVKPAFNECKEKGSSPGLCCIFKKKLKWKRLQVKCGSDNDCVTSGEASFPDAPEEDHYVSHQCDETTAETALLVRETFPRSGETKVPVDSAIDIFFNLPVDIKSVASNFSLLEDSAEPISIQGVWLQPPEDGSVENIATFLPQGMRLKPATTYVATLHPKAHSNQTPPLFLGDTLTWSFTTGSPGLSTFHYAILIVVAALFIVVFIVYLKRAAFRVNKTNGSIR